MDELERWQRIINGGFVRCLLVRGLLGWSLPFCLLFGAVRTMLNDPGPYWRHAVAGWPLAIGAGLIYGLGLWGFAKLQLTRARQTQEKKED
ncbi:hypothetical protein [Andreprevotia chitinilytica]|uniref:hypothetical protein n=1 Tax=Andreprevotia chitinilytica TaxID=396808 RepID=UPI000559112A|nr:hypothetical protein [Andreprevotia chitinilytica]